MEMLLIGLVAVVAFAAVLFPLLRRKVGTGDEREFENVPPAHNVTSTIRPGIDTSAEPGVATAPGHGAGAATGSAGSTAADAADADRGGTHGRDVEAEVLRYRSAVRAGTVCRKCGQANPASSVYCYECGERLPLADAKEFE